MDRMRRFLVVVTCTLLLSLTLAIPTKAAASTRLTLQPSPNVIELAGATVTLTGRLVVGGTSSPGVKRLSIQQRIPGTKTWQTYASVATNRLGRYRLALHLSSPAEFRSRYTGDRFYTAATSPSVTVAQQPVVTASLDFPEPVGLGDSGALRGSVQPNLSGRQVQIERKDGEVWRSIGTATIDLASQFSIQVRAEQAESVVYRAYLPASPGYLEARSPELPLTIQGDPPGEGDDDIGDMQRQLMVAYCKALGAEMEFLTGLGGAAPPGLVFVSKLSGDVSEAACLNDPTVMSQVFHNFGKYLVEYFIDRGVGAIGDATWNRILDDILARMQVDLEPYLSYIKNLFNKWILDAIDALNSAMNACFASRPFPAPECSLMPQILALEAHLLK